MIIKERFTKIANFMTPGNGSCVLVCYGVAM